MSTALLQQKTKALNGTFELLTDTQDIGKKVVGVGAVVLFAFVMYKVFSA